MRFYRIPCTLGEGILSRLGPPSAWRQALRPLEVLASGSVFCLQLLGRRAACSRSSGGIRFYWYLLWAALASVHAVASSHSFKELHSVGVVLVRRQLSTLVGLLIPLQPFAGGTLPGFDFISPRVWSWRAAVSSAREMAAHSVS